ncbi:MAG: ABC transporter permease, partial [Alphaproteobacteria bacterium]
MAERAASGLALRLARRELRRGLRGFRVFVACLTIGVGAIAAVGSLSQAVLIGLAGEARALLAGDVALRLAGRAASTEESAYLAAAGRLSTSVELHAMARPAAGEARPAMVHLKAVDGAYPLYGAVRLEPAMPLAAALATRDGLAGAAVE